MDGVTNQYMKSPPQTAPLQLEAHSHREDIRRFYIQSQIESAPHSKHAISSLGWSDPTTFKPFII